ncbi:gamma-glutamyltransferase [Bradyrhizobium sp. Pear76]|uniref:gamma-glutamyltransferase family protein n=1 Tax=Bradyrhizobium oropedii TaxID=1571201 RepID=UPI001E558294|nr:gamma-glutamyltransferase [Bradyrhizobium oropedii]MCC8965367.1 gamma-glutamyltransferase [Bradyrhizobium oropedii]
MNGKTPTVSSLTGIVAAAHPLAANAGSRILAAGGNAFDAAAATAAALNVVEPYNSGLAGMGIAICYVAAEDRIRVLDFVPAFPRGFDFASTDERMSLRRGGYGTGLPGCLAGWAELGHRYGNMTLADTLVPAINLARDGFPLIELNVEALRASRQQLSSFPELLMNWTEVYGKSDTENQSGSVLRQPKLAATYEAVAKSGIRYLYDGPLGHEIVEAVRAHGGCLTEDDIASSKPRWQEPISVNYRGSTIYAPPPPSHGFQYLLTMGLLGKFNLPESQRSEGDRLDILFRAIRSAARTRIECEIENTGAFAQLIDDVNLSRLQTIALSRDAIEGPTEYTTVTLTVDRSRENTTSFSVADRSGNMVAITQSLGQYFGSGIITREHGVALNDLLHYGNIEEGSAGARSRVLGLPFCPSIVVSPDRVLAFGTPGSFGIPQTQAQVLVNYLDRGMSLQDAIDAPRARLWPGRSIEIESRVGEAALEILAKHGHDIKPASGWTKLVGGMQGIVRDRATGVMSGAADLRRDGCVAIA